MAYLKRRLFEALRIRFSSGISLDFEVLDFPLAQRWASLVYAYSSVVDRPWQVRKLQYWIQLQSRLEFQLQVVTSCQDDVDFRQSLIWSDDAYCSESLARIVEWGKVKRDRAEGPAAGRAAAQLLQTAEDLMSALRRRKSVPLNALILQPIKFEFHQMAQPLFNDDFSHFQAGRIPGGLRLYCPEGPESRSAFTCAEAMNPAYLPTPMRKFSAAFRIDLSPSYAKLENWETYRRLVQWANELRFDLEDVRNWANSVYVAKLKDPSQIPALGEKLLRDQLALEAIELGRSV